MRHKTGAEKLRIKNSNNSNKDCKQEFTLYERKIALAELERRRRLAGWGFEEPLEVEEKEVPAKANTLLASL
ncbi:hypothetical protein HPB48_015922 [Haemaphysalis longicornis]|uniref:Uncharacterized protein n=1 Tax=Haemaphysalis longicornis TaxID=44386 RepID=A0A9J6H382_HAELO|nr:hypothetical protein HPB48_015922 [Haemaphysalis longicornis]